MSDNELSMNRVECPKCKAIWLNGQHMWYTGKTGDEEALSNLVCSVANSEECINPKYIKGQVYEDKDSWQKRSGFLDKVLESGKDA